jgi:hypothetical protein
VELLYETSGIDREVEINAISDGMNRTWRQTPQVCRCVCVGTADGLYCVRMYMVHSSTTLRKGGWI